jgi:hypothetical protein
MNNKFETSKKETREERLKRCEAEKNSWKVKSSETYELTQEQKARYWKERKEWGFVK